MEIQIPGPCPDNLLCSSSGPGGGGFGGGGAYSVTSQSFLIPGSDLAGLYH